MELSFFYFGHLIIQLTSVCGNGLSAYYVQGKNKLYCVGLGLLAQMKRHLIRHRIIDFQNPGTTYTQLNYILFFFTNTVKIPIKPPKRTQLSSNIKPQG